MRRVETLVPIKGWDFYESELKIGGRIGQIVQRVVTPTVYYTVMSSLEPAVYRRNYVRSATSLAMAITGSRESRPRPKRIPWQIFLRRRC